MVAPHHASIQISPSLIHHTPVGKNGRLQRTLQAALIFKIYKGAMKEKLKLPKDK